MHPMASDLLATLLALCLWPVFALAPGIVFLRLAKIRDPAISMMPVSFAVSPILAYLIARFGSVTLAAAVFVGLALVSLPWLRPSLRRPPRWAVVAGLAWAVPAYLLMSDIVFGGALSLSGMAIDYAKHVAVADAVARTGVPPANPSFRPGEDVPLFYYHFWFMLAGIVDVIGGAAVAARHAVYAGTIWTGWALLALVAALSRRFLDGRDCAPWAVALLAVTGLDMLPFAAIQAYQSLMPVEPAWRPDLEWWNEQVSAWATAMLWVPHHLAALIAGMTGLVALHGEEWRRGRIILAALAFASSAGLSVWVALTTAVAAAVWLFVLALGGQRREAAALAGAGTVALLLAAPFVADLLAAGGGGGAPLAFALREFYPLTRSREFFAAELDCGAACRMAALPLNYLLEFGFFALAPIVYWCRRKTPLNDDDRLLITLAATALVLVSVVRSDLAANDLGWRGTMFAQMVLLLWAAPVLAGLRGGGGGMAPGRGRALLNIALALGLLATLTQALSLRLRPLLPGQLELRQTYTWIAANLPADAVVQHDPAVGLEPFHAIYGGRQVAVSDTLYGSLYGVAPERVMVALRPLARVFAAPVGAAEAAATARRFGITHLVAKAADRAWVGRHGWVWTAEPLFETATTRVIAVDDLPVTAAAAR